jgi:ribose-phosphate pyrophosphokinase
MILFSFSNYGHIARQLQALSFVQRGQFTAGRYDNQELHATVQGPVSTEHCLILGSIAPPDEQMLSFTLLAHTLKKEGANKITAVLPYLAYTRQDKDKREESLATAWIGSLLKAAGLDEVLTVDVHSERDKRLFPMPIVSLSTADLFAAAIKKHRLTDATIVAPDNGAISRCEAVMNAAGMPNVDTPYFKKRRSKEGIILHGPVGEVGPRVVIIDDMLDTGGTLVSACEKLIEAKVEEIYILVTHGLFTGTNWTKLWSLRVKHIFCTDTVPFGTSLETANITVLSVVPLLQERLSSIADERARGMTVRGE